MIPFSTSSFAWATFLVNMGGCFAMGACLPYMHDSITKTLLMAGILGGFTTFSGLGLELLRYLDDQQWKMALLYAGSSLILGTVLVWLGYKLGITIQ
jgi:CrcB protein